MHVHRGAADTAECNPAAFSFLNGTTLRGDNVAFHHYRIDSEPQVLAPD